MPSNIPLHSVFFFKNQLPMHTKPAVVVKAVCSIVNVTEVDTVQIVDNMYRIDLKNAKAKKAIVLRGLTIKGVFISLMDLTPEMLNGSGKKNLLKVTIGNIPSTSDIKEAEVLDAIKGLGFTVRSPFTEEYHRDPDTYESLGVKSGRLVIYVDEPDFELPKSFTIGERLASLQYNGNKRKNTNSEGPPNGNIMPKNHVNKAKMTNNAINSNKPSEQQKKEEREKVISELKAFSQKKLNFNHVPLDLPKSPEIIMSSIQNDISNEDPETPRINAIKRLKKHNRRRGGRTQSLERKEQKKRLRSGESDHSHSDVAKSIKTTHHDYDSDNEIGASGNLLFSQYDWFKNPQSGLQDDTPNGGV